MRGGKPLAAAMEVHYLPAQRAALRHAGARRRPEGAHEVAVLADDVEQTIHNGRCSEGFASLNV